MTGGMVEALAVFGAIYAGALVIAFYGMLIIMAFSKR